MVAVHCPNGNWCLAVAVMGYTFGKLDDAVRCFKENHKWKLMEEFTPNPEVRFISKTLNFSLRQFILISVLASITVYKCMK